MTSLRHSVLLWTTALLTVVGLIAFAISYQMTRSETAGFLDGQLREIALNAGDGIPEAEAPTSGQDAQDPEDAFVVTLWSASGEPVRKPKRGVIVPKQSIPGFATVSAGGEMWRVYSAGGGGRAVQVAQRVAVREEIAQSAAIQAGIPILAAIPLMWLVIGWSIGQALGPLTALTESVATRGVIASETIPVAGVPVEITPLIEAMNGLIKRLQRSILRERRFLADAAHQLRTPLAALHIQVDNLRSMAGVTEASAVLELRAGIRRASALVDQLLRMARLDEVVSGQPHQPVDLAAHIGECVADLIVQAEAKGVDLGIAVCEPTTIFGEASELKALFGNLIDNAIRYTPAGGSVDVSLRSAGASSFVEIVDTGCGVAIEDLPRLRDRFFRAAPAETEGNGLGLAIADAVAKRNAMRIDFANRDDRGGLRVTVWVEALDRTTPTQFSSNAK